MAYNNWEPTLSGLEGNTMAQPRVFGHDAKAIVIGAIDNSNPNIFTNFTAGTEGYATLTGLATTGGGGTGLTVNGLSVGEIAPLVGNLTITTAGTGYSNGTSVVLTGGSGTGAKANVSVNAGVIDAINISDLGSKGYVIGDVLTVSGGNGDATVTVAGLLLTGVTLAAVGSGYTLPTLAAPQTITLADGVGAGVLPTFKLAQDVAINIPNTQRRGCVVYNGNAAQTVSLVTEADSTVNFPLCQPGKTVGDKSPILAKRITAGSNLVAVY